MYWYLYLPVPPMIGAAVPSEASQPATTGLVPASQQRLVSSSQTKPHGWSQTFFFSGKSSQN